MAIAACNATLSSADASACVLNNRVSSQTKDFPALPDGTLNGLSPCSSFE